VLSYFKIVLLGELSGIERVSPEALIDGGRGVVTRVLLVFLGVFLVGEEVGFGSEGGRL
jgi:hypothetical protein